MNIITKRLLFATAAAMVSLSYVSAAEVPYAAGDFANTIWWGTGKTENYDVCARLDGSMKGLDVNSLTFEVPEDSGITGFSIWLSEELTLDADKKNSPDVISVPVTPENGRISVRFAKPYTIGEKGVYAGYSFSVSDRETESRRNPVGVVHGNGNDGCGIWVHSSRTYIKWTENAAGVNNYLPFSLILGGAREHAVEIRLPAEVNAATGSNAVLEAEAVNYGASGAGSLGLAWKAAYGSGTLSVTPETPLSQAYGATAKLKIVLPATGAIGTEDLQISVASVDGSANEAAAPGASAKLYVWSSLPLKRPLMEEYTATDCGMCGRGAIGMERLKKLEKDRFVGIAYHVSDVMSVLSAAEFPSPAPGQPVAWMDRRFSTDPYFGNNMAANVFSADKVWEEVAAEFTPASLELSCYWEDDTKQAVVAEAKAGFVKPFESADIRLTYALVADGLTGEGVDWVQANYYSGETGKWPADFAPLVEAPRLITNYVYNDVVILAPSPLGIEGSLPANIGQDKTYSHSCRLNLADALNLEGMKLAHDGLTYRVVAILVNAADGLVLNCAESTVADGSSVTSVENNTEVIGVSFYDLTGTRLSSRPATGLYLEATTYADGTRRITKRLVR